MHTAETCEISTHDHFGQREAFENGTGREPLPDSDELLCGACDRCTFYNYADERYHHLTEPERGCFLIAAEDPDTESAEGAGSRDASEQDEHQGEDQQPADALDYGAAAEEQCQQQEHDH